MATYCDVTDVSKEMQHYTFTASSQPTSAEVTTLCDEVSAYMESRLRTVLSLPISDTAGLARLKQTAVYGVVTRIYRGMKDDPDLVKQYQNLFDNELKDILAHPDTIESSAVESTITHGFTKRTDPKYPRDESTW